MMDDEYLILKQFIQDLIILAEKENIQIDIRKHDDTIEATSSD